MDQFLKKLGVFLEKTAPFFWKTSQFFLKTEPVFEIFEFFEKSKFFENFGRFWLAKTAQNST